MPNPMQQLDVHELEGQKIHHGNHSWLPRDKSHISRWLRHTIHHVDQNPKDLHPVLKEFRNLIEDDTRLFLLFSTMFKQIPKGKHYKRDPNGDAQIRDYNHMLELLNYLLTEAPAWNDYSIRLGLVGLPINAMLDWSMATQSGFALFLDPKVNAVIQKVLNAWGEFLTSPASTSVLNGSKTGWFGPVGMKSLEDTANLGKTSYKFHELYVCDEKAKHYGFKSWDHFFTRVYREGIRPIASPSDDDVIVSACESMPYKTTPDVQLRDRFWLKSQRYSLVDMLDDTLAIHFVGGTIYQAFLSSTSYHRWHSPVAGRIVKAYVKEGSYYSEPPYEDFTSHDGGDANNQADCQEYLSATAARAVIFIEADNPAIGLMVFMGIGMAEVSTCEINVEVGQHVKKGQEIGMFHFGGSTHVLMFHKDVDVHGFPEPGEREFNVPVNGEVARVRSTRRSELEGEAGVGEDEGWAFVVPVASCRTE